MNWTPDYDYNGNTTGWNDGNQHGYRLNDAVLAASLPSPRSFIRSIGRAILAVVILTAVATLFLQVRYFSTKPALSVSHPTPSSSQAHPHHKQRKGTY